MTTATAPVPGPGILDIAPYVGGEAKAPGSSGRSAWPRTKARSGRAPRRSPPIARSPARSTAIPTAAPRNCAPRSAAHHELDPERIVCGAGSDELIGLLLRAYAGPGSEVLYSRHGFLMYPIGAQAVGATPVAVPERDADRRCRRDPRAASPTRTRIVFIANPNNPTGTYLSAGEMARLHAGLPANVVLAIDAAYAEFVNRNDYEPGIALVNRAENVVMLRTFSKIYALAGLRLGWAYFPPAIADVLNRMRGPFNVSAPALAAGVAAVEDTEALARARAHNDRWLPWLSERLAALGLARRRASAISCCRAFPEIARHNADAAFGFLQARGILTRKMGGYGLPHHLRITIGTGEEMEKVAAALAEFMAPDGVEWAPAVRPRRHHRDRADRLVAGAGDAARQPGDASSSPAPAAPRRWPRCAGSTSPTRPPTIRPPRSRAPISSCSRRRFRPMPRSAARIAPALRPGAIVTDVGSVKERGDPRLCAGYCRPACISCPAIRSPAPSIPAPRPGSPRCSATAGAS